MEYKDSGYIINTKSDYNPSLSNIRIQTVEVIGNSHDQVNVNSEVNG